jgi:hypothetical protein
MQPAEPGIEAEQETQHWRILFGQKATNCFPVGEPAPASAGLWFPIAFAGL